MKRGSFSDNLAVALSASDPGKAWAQDSRGRLCPYMGCRENCREPRQKSKAADRSVRRTRSRAEAEEFGSKTGVMLGLAEIGYFVAGGFGEDEFEELMLFMGRPAS